LVAADLLDSLVRNWIAEFEPVLSRLTGFQRLAARAVNAGSVLRRTNVQIPWQPHAELVELLKASGRFDLVVNIGHSGASVVAEDIPFRLAAIASDPHGGSIVEDRLLQAITELREFMTLDQVPVTVASELYGFAADTPFSIDDHLSLVPNTSEPGPITSSFFVPQPAFCLEARGTVGIGFGVPAATSDQDAQLIDSLYKDVNRAANVLMVSQQGTFIPGPMKLTYQNWVPLVGFQRGAYRPTFPSGFEQFDFDVAEIGVLQRRLEAATSLEGSASEHLLVALHRFFLAQMRETPEDRLIDFMIAAEALFLNDNRQELSFRLATRAAMFLADAKTDRVEIFKAMRAAYDLRSRLVHGDRPDLGRVFNSERETERLMRLAIQKALDLVADNMAWAINKWDDLAFLGI